MTSTYRAEINGETVYLDRAHREWEQVYLCDGCTEELTPEKMVCIRIDILHGRTVQNIDPRQFDIHSTCLPALIQRYSKD